MGKQQIPGYVRQLPSGRWQARYNAPNGAMVSAGTFDTESEAWKALTRVEAAILEDRWQPPKKPITLREFSADWFAAQTHTSETWQTSRQYSLRYILAEDLGRYSIARLPLKRIGHDEIRDWYRACLDKAHGRIVETSPTKYAALARKWAKSQGYRIADTGKLPDGVMTMWFDQGKPGVKTADTDRGIAAAYSAYSLLRTILEDAERGGHINKIPPKVKGVRASAGRDQSAISIADFKRFMFEVHPNWRNLIIVLAWTKCRPSEILALKRQDVEINYSPFGDVTGAVIKIRRGAVLVNGRMVEREQTKTKAGRRPVPVPVKAASALAEHLKAHPGKPFEYVFATATGALIDQSNLRREMRKWQTRAGIVLESKRNITPYTLRRSVTAWGATNNLVSAENQRAAMGHTTTRMTEHYICQGSTMSESSAAYLDGMNQLETLVDLTII